ncbi:hypothetical protein [Paenibacillus silvae]|uniref:hypothetical protein n=1 Tax=Paenibacillus silvae TaxID=1325358 RepID=UPI00142D35F8|nr:hypothetical protein [Paenibacillus silvae]
MNEKCIKCDGEIYESESLSRCLRCRSATAREVSGEDYFKSKNITNKNEELNE